MSNNFPSRETAQKWCDRHQYTDLQLVDNHWWAIPPNGVIPVCIQAELLELTYWQWWAISPGGMLPNRPSIRGAKRKFWERLDELGCKLLDILG